VKKIGLSILLLLIGITNVKAVETYDRTLLDNYGVNKKWQITEYNKSNVLDSYKVNSDEKIYDFSDVLTDDEEILLKGKINSFIEKYDTDLVLFIDDLTYYSDYTNEDYAVDFYDYNDFGINYERYDGILLFRNTYSIDPYYDMYTFGDAQLYFDQNRYDDILDAIYNDIKSKNYYIGFSTFIDMLDDYYDSGIPYSMRGYKVDENGYLYEVYAISWFKFSGISAVVTLIIIIILIKRNKMISKVNHANDYLDKDSINYRVKKDNFVRSYTRSYTTSSSSGGSGGGSRSGSSGGGHSSGGGRHG